MKRRILRLMLGAFTTWMRLEMDPAGKASFHLFDARATKIIDELGARDSPTLEAIQGLTEESVLAGMTWVLTALRVAYPDDWAPVAIEMARVILRRNLTAITALAQPPVLAESLPQLSSPKSSS